MKKLISPTPVPSPGRGRLAQVIVLLCLSLAAVVVQATPVSQSDAGRVANRFWQTVLHGEGLLQACPWEYDHVYLFAGENGGYVMVSADDCARPIIAYSLHGSIHPEALPRQLAERMEYYDVHIAAGVREQAKATSDDAERWAALLAGVPTKDGDSDDRVDPLLETRWHQDGGYALFTPEHTPVGCAATAQGQLMRFWRYPAFGRGHVSYNCQPYGAQSADFAHTLYDWENMPAQVSTASPMEEQTAVSTLLYHIGVSLHMGYAPGGSGAAGLAGQPGYPSIDNSLKDYFYYNPGMRALFKTASFTDQQWNDSLKAELQLGHPIVYCGVAPEGGHGFVCDGYEYREGQIYFHFNFGWSGVGDGYYTTDDICPNVSPTGDVGSAYHFNQSNQALLGAVPDYRLHVSDTILTYSRDGGVSQLFFASIGTSDSPWNVSADHPWVHIERNGIDKVGAVSVTVDENGSGSERQAFVTFMQNGQTVTVKVVQTYYAEEDYCPLTVVMESTRNGGWEGGAYLSFESLSGYVYNTATLRSGSSETVSVGVAPHDVNVVFHGGGGTDRYINYRVLNRYDEELVNVEYAFMNGGTHYIEWPCARLGIESPTAEVKIWPNPASDRLNIEAEGLLGARLFDAAGHEVSTLPAHGSQMVLEGIPAGVYFLQVVTENGMSVGKIVKTIPNTGH